MKKTLSTFFVLILICGTTHAKTSHHGKHKKSHTVEQTQSTTSTEDDKDPNAPVTPLEVSLTKEKELLNRELVDLKKTASNALQIKTERDGLQERFVNVERDLQQLKVENQALKDSTNQDWFLYGGGLALAGVLLGFIIPKISWGRRNTWGSF